MAASDMPLVSRLFVRARNRVPSIESLTPEMIDAVQRPPRTAVEHAVERFLGGGMASGVDSYDSVIPTDGVELPAAIYVPRERRHPAPLVVHFHGGGWIAGHHRSGQFVCSRYAKRAGAVVVSVGYRLAPEHVFPTAVFDAWAGLHWAIDNAESWAADATRLAVFGDSAGGNLATVVAIRARDAGGPQIAHQGLLYPFTDAYMTKDWIDADRETPLLQPGDMVTTYEMYTGRPVTDEEAADDWRFSPLQAESLANLAPAFVAVGGNDPLHDQIVAYANRMRNEGVEVTLREYASMPHGYTAYPDFFPDARPTIDAMIDDALRFLIR